MTEAERQNLTQWREAMRWLNFAAQDLRAAKLTATDDEILGTTAFHVQQTVEKILKALLVAAGADIRRIHDLVELAELAHRYWPDFVPTDFPLARVTSWYILSRYPGIDDIELDASDISVALNEAGELLDRTMQLVPSGIHLSNDPS